MRRSPWALTPLAAFCLWAAGCGGTSDPVPSTIPPGAAITCSTLFGRCSDSISCCDQDAHGQPTFLSCSKIGNPNYGLCETSLSFAPRGTECDPSHDNCCPSNQSCSGGRLLTCDPARRICSDGTCFSSRGAICVNDADCCSTGANGQPTYLTCDQTIGVCSDGGCYDFGQRCANSTDCCGNMTCGDDKLCHN